MDGGWSTVFILLSDIAAGWMGGFTFWNWWIGQHQRDNVRELTRHNSELIHLMNVQQVESKQLYDDLLGQVVMLQQHVLTLNQCTDGQMGWVRHVAKDQAVSLDGSPPG